MACPSFKVSVNIPVFGLAFTPDNQLIVAGGGGASRSGVKNKLISYKVDIRRQDLEEDATYDFKADEDAPMCLDVHPKKSVVITGVNEPEEKLKAGTNNNCRVLNVLNDKFEQKKSFKTLESKKSEDYQRVARFSEDGSLFATGATDGIVNVFKYPELQPFSKPISVDKDEILDVDINLEKEKLTCIIREKLFLINLRGKNVGQVVQTISSSDVIKKGTFQFRAFRYGRGFSKDFAYAVLNGVTKPGSYIVKYDAYTLNQIKSVKVSDKPITAFTISNDGAAIAFASADLSVTLLETNTLNKLTKIKDAHGFSITCVAISPDRRLLASASADHTCRVVSLPLQFNTSLSVNPLLTLLAACIVSAVLLLITTQFNIEPFFTTDPAANQLVVPEPKDLNPTFSSITQDQANTIESVIAQTTSNFNIPTETESRSRDEF